MLQTFLVVAWKGLEVRVRRVLTSQPEEFLYKHRFGVELNLGIRQASDGSGKPSVPSERLCRMVVEAITRCRAIRLRHSRGRQCHPQSRLLTHRGTEDLARPSAATKLGFTHPMHPCVHRFPLLQAQTNGERPFPSSPSVRSTRGRDRRDGDDERGSPRLFGTVGGSVESGLMIRSERYGMFLSKTASASPSAVAFASALRPVK